MSYTEFSIILKGAIDGLGKLEERSLFPQSTKQLTDGCLDLNPAAGGKVGQIISYWHTNPDRKVLATGFRDWLTQFADDLESGQYQVEEGWLVR